MTHRSRLSGFIIDCNTDDLDAATDFWAGALGCSIAGSGPSLFAFSSSEKTAREAGNAMQHAFLTSSAKLASDMWVSPICSEGAKILS